MLFAEIQSTVRKLMVIIAIQQQNQELIHKVAIFNRVNHSKHNLKEMHFCIFTFLVIIRVIIHILFYFLCRWETGEWSVCSKSCGGGLKIRKVFCEQEKNGTKIQVRKKRNENSGKNKSSKLL